MITLAVGEMFYFIAIRLTSITGGENGLGDIRLGHLFWIDLTSRVNFFYLSAWVTFIAVACAWFITHSPYGRVCRAIQQNRARVPFLGFDTVRYRERAFVMSAGISFVSRTRSRPPSPGNMRSSRAAWMRSSVVVGRSAGPSHSCQ